MGRGVHGPAEAVCDAARVAALVLGSGLVDGQRPVFDLDPVVEGSDGLNWDSWMKKSGQI